MTVTIRPARPADAGVVHRFILALADYERLAHMVEATEGQVAESLFGPAPKVFCDLAFAEDRPAGFALWFYTYSTFQGRHGLYLEDLYVDPALRGRGIGKALLQALARRCVAEGLGRLQWSVLDWNEPSIAFYRSLGAVPVEGWTGYRVTGEALARLGAEPGEGGRPGGGHAG